MGFYTLCMSFTGQHDFLLDRHEITIFRQNCGIGYTFIYKASTLYFCISKLYIKIYQVDFVNLYFFFDTVTLEIGFSVVFKNNELFPAVTRYSAKPVSVLNFQAR